MAANLAPLRGAGNRNPRSTKRQSMTRRSAIKFLSAAVLGASSGCAPPWLSPPPRLAPPPPPPAYEFPHDTVWSAHPRITLADDSASIVVARPFTALAVLSADSAVIEVRCESCPGAPAGMVRHRDVVYEVGRPAEVAHGPLAEFALAVRDAAARGDVEALAPVMASDFTFALLGPPGADRALAAWTAEGFNLLHEVPVLLDQGLSSVDGEIWVAPPTFSEDLDYRGLRLGFRRSAQGRWEWIFLVRGQGLTTER